MRFGVDIYMNQVCVLFLRLLEKKKKKKNVQLVES